LLLAAGYELAAPSFESTPAAPQPWGLWLGTNGEWDGTEMGDFLELQLSPKNGCGEPVTAFGEADWSGGTTSAAERHFKILRTPTQLLLGVANAHVYSGEIRVPAAERWHPMRVIRFRNIYVLDGHVRHWDTDERSVQFRFQLAVSRPAGYESCDLTSPALFEFQGAEPAWGQASQAPIYFQELHPEKETRLHEWPLDDAIIWMGVPHRSPDRTVLDAGAQVRRNRILVTCTGVSPNPSGDQVRDPFYYRRTLTEESSCASVQTFRAAAASDSLNRRIFIAGILFSAAVGILLEAFITGTIDRDDRREFGVEPTPT
jgi:hypothetical protein